MCSATSSVLRSSETIATVSSPMNANEPPSRGDQTELHDTSQSDTSLAVPSTPSLDSDLNTSSSPSYFSRRVSSSPPFFTPGLLPDYDIQELSSRALASPFIIRQADSNACRSTLSSDIDINVIPAVGTTQGSLSRVSSLSELRGTNNSNSSIPCSLGSIPPSSLSSLILNAVPSKLQHSKRASYSGSHSNVSRSDSSSTESSTASILSTQNMTDSKTFFELQAQAAKDSTAAISALQRDGSQTAASNQAPSRFNLGRDFPLRTGRLIQHHQTVRSPSLPANSVSSQIELPSSVSPISPRELDKLLSDAKTKSTTLVVDVRPFNQYSKRRISQAVNICVPSTLLKRPTYSLLRFGECMMPSQRHVLDNLSQFNAIIIYDQSTIQVPTRTYSPIAYTLLKFSCAENLQCGLNYLQGGFSSFEEGFPSSIDNSSVGVSEAQQSDSHHSSSPGYKNMHSSNPSYPHINHPQNTRHSSDTPPFNFPPVLTGFSLPINSLKDGPLKPFASNIRPTLEHFDVEKTSPIELPLDIAAQEIKNYFPLWLQDVISKETGPRHITRRFYDIEQAEKVRLQSAFHRGSRIGNADSPVASSPISMTPEETGTKYSFSAGVELGTKNRYNNIWPYDHTRVKLCEFEDHPTSLSSGSESSQMPAPSKPCISSQGEKPCDYFNASYITANGTSLRYIATQAPLPDTFVDFWQVVWDKRIPVIVMLTAETEGGSIKCHRYWNEGVYGAVKLLEISSEQVELSPLTGTAVTVRRFFLTTTAAAKAGSQPLPSHTVVQLQFTSWPDRGALVNPQDLISLCALKNQYVETYKTEQQLKHQSFSESDGLSPWTLVHCSAGCGRTGTFCTVDSVINLLEQQLKAGSVQNSIVPTTSGSSPFHSLGPQLHSAGKQPKQARPADKDSPEYHDLIYRMVHNFRRQRLSMVQVLRQYSLCYETIILWVHNQYKAQQKKFLVHS